MTIYQMLMIPIIATTIYMIGDLLVSAGIRHDSKTLHRIGCLLVVAAVATVALLWVGLWSVR